MSTVIRAVRFLSFVHGTTVAVRNGQRTMDEVFRLTIRTYPRLPKLLSTCGMLCLTMVGYRCGGNDFMIHECRQGRLKNVRPISFFFLRLSLSVNGMETRKSKHHRLSREFFFFHDSLLLVSPRTRT